MTKAVLTTKVDPTYDDLPEARYHFPRAYLRQVEAAVGDWIVYYEPRRTSGDLSSRGGRQAYIATARIDRIEPDPGRPDHFYAFVSGYLDFARPVPFREGEISYERGLTKEDGSTNKGAFGRAVRNLTDPEYDRIVQAGYAHTLETIGAEIVPSHAGRPRVPGFLEEPQALDRPIVERLIVRKFRDAAFADAVKSAYENTCAMTGLRIINGGGRAEVQAAHIRPVADNGPDSVRNGLALSSTIHWMFDRGLVSIDDDHSLLIARGRLPETIERLLNPDHQLRKPVRVDFMPHPQFLRYHRMQLFKG